MKTIGITLGAAVALFSVQGLVGVASAQTCAVNTYPCPDASILHDDSSRNPVVASTDRPSFPDDVPPGVIVDPVDPEGEPNGAGSGNGGGDPDAGQ